MDKKTILHIAQLAKIGVLENAEVLSEDLSAILKWIDILQEVDTTNVNPMYSTTQTKFTSRADVVNDGDKKDAVLTNAPKSNGGYFVVPKVIE